MILNNIQKATASQNKASGKNNQLKSIAKTYDNEHQPYADYCEE